LSAVAISKKNIERKILQLPYIVSISMWYSADALLPVRQGFLISECRVRLLPAGEQGWRWRYRLSTCGLPPP